MSLEEKVENLEKKLEEVTKQVGKLEDVNAVRHLQYKYGYYIDKCLYDEAVDLFAEDGEVHFLGGIYKGRAGIRRLYIDRFRKNFTGGKNGPVPGFLLDHPMFQFIVDVSPDRKSAYIRGRTLMQAGRHESNTEESYMPRQWWEGGIYENEYVKDDGVWKIKTLNYRPFWHADFDEGWAKTKPGYVPLPDKTFPEDPIGPDELIKPVPHLWPNTDVVPFHYAHPVTGKMWKPD